MAKRARLPLTHITRLLVTALAVMVAWIGAALPPAASAVGSPSATGQIACTYDAPRLSTGHDSAPSERGPPPTVAYDFTAVPSADDYGSPGASARTEWVSAGSTTTYTSPAGFVQVTRTVGMTRNQVQDECAELSALGESRGAAKAGTEVAETCLNSFTGTTLVLMADGTKKPIKDVKLGDWVMAAGPETGESGPRKVVDLIRHGGLHTMVAVQLADGTTIDATDRHPFWVASRGEWIDAIDLQPGDVVVTADGEQLTVARLRISKQDLTAYNLTVAGLHTYFAGSASVLVHNAGPCMSLNQMNSAIRRGQAPKGIERIDRGKVPGAEQPHAVFGRGQGAPSLNIDGTWKHGPPVELTRKQRDWLIANGWNL